MIEKKYLLDTHVIYQWAVQERVSTNFIDFFNTQSVYGNVYISSVSIWELAFLNKKRKIDISDLHVWKNELLAKSQAKMIDPTVSEMIDSTLLPDHHKDPFDRLLIVQAKNLKAFLVTRDEKISHYEIETFWIDGGR
jgi:PIN domain nuclease of toxin-antitoxin system